MFLDRLLSLNPELARGAVRLHQSGTVLANTYLLDLDTIGANVRAIRDGAAAAGLSLYAMTKQFARNPDACGAIVDAGIPSAVAVDIQCMEAVLRSRMRIGHVGHLVQPHQGTEDAVIAATPEVVTVFDIAIAERLGAAAIRAARTQAVLLRVVDATDRFYFGHGGGFPLESIESCARSVDAIAGLRVVGVTTFPAILADADAGRIMPTPNLATLAEAAQRLRRAGWVVEQVNAPGTTSAGTMRLLADAGATHVEPGNGLLGTTPLMVLDPTSPEIPAIVYVSEVSHLDGNDAYVFGAGLYIDRVLGDYQLRAIVGRDDSALGRVVPAEMAPDGAIHYYAKLHLSPRHGVRVGDTVVFCFRPQVFVTRGRTRSVQGLGTGVPVLGGTYDVDARRIDGVA